MTDDHPDVIDAKGGRWTWRGEGYALSTVTSPTDFRGRPWTTSAETIAEQFGTWSREEVPA